MDDIFQKAKAGNEAAIKGLYTCSVTSAFRVLLAVTGEEEKAVEMVKEIYISAFGSAKNYDGFFVQLNKRAVSACKILINKDAVLSPIEATDGMFADLESLEIPQELKDFAQTLCALVTARPEKRTAKKGKEKKLFGKKKKAMSELEEFEELVKRREFSAIEKAAPKKEEEAPKPKTLAEKMQAEEGVISDEQRTKERIEQEKNKRASIVAFAFAAVILVAVFVTYFLIGKSGGEWRFATTETATTAVTTTAPTTKRYTEGEAQKAFDDYYKEVILQTAAELQPQRIVAYDETKAIGLEQLNGIVTKKRLDLDGDNQEELAVIKLHIYPEGGVYRFVYTLELYTFEDLEVKVIAENYPLLTYSLYNRSIDYTMCDFTMHLKLVKCKNGKCLYASAVSENMKLYAYHFYQGGELKEAERLAYYTWDKNGYILLQNRADGTWQPLLYSSYKSPEKSVEFIAEEVKTDLQNYGIVFASMQVKFDTQAAALKYLNALCAPFGCSFDKDYLASTNADNTKDICVLTAVNEQGYKLSRREIVKVEDLIDKTGA